MFANIFALFFSQPSQIHNLSGGVNIFCDKCSVHSQLKRSPTDRQTDRRKCDR